MRAALISIAGQPRDGAGSGPARIGGRPLAHRQLAFALAAGAEQIVVLGDGASREAIELRHAAESAGARVLAIGDGHGLLGVVRAADHLLVLSPGVLPEAPAVLDMLGKGSSLLVLPAAQGVAAGFERIDLERAWAGVLTIQGGLVERLAELAPDIDPAAALLRIALQAQVAERRLPESLLTDGSWAMVKSGEDAASAERAWLIRNLPEAPPSRPVRWLAARALRPAAAKLIERARAAEALGLAAVALLVAGVASCAAGWAVTGFVLAGLGVVTGELFAGLSRLVQAPFASDRRAELVTRALGALADLSLAAVAMLAIEQDWLHRLFPPLVLFGLLRVFRPEEHSGFAALLGDRLLLALALALAAAVGLTEPAIMILALALILLEVAKRLKGGG